MKKSPFALVVAVLCCVLLLPQVAAAQQKDPNDNDTFVPSGGGIPIPDNGYDGTIGSMACLNYNVTDGTVGSVSVNITLEHTYVGDLTFKLVSPQGTILTMMSRPGYDEAADDGVGCCGNSSNLIQSSPLFFANGNTYDPELMGDGQASGDFVCQDNGECDYFANPATGPGTDFSDFVGEDSGGDWQVCVGDGAGADIGNLIDATVNVATGVPTTSQYGLLLLLVLLAGGSLLVLRRGATTH